MQFQKFNSNLDLSRHCGGLRGTHRLVRRSRFVKCSLLGADYKDEAALIKEGNFWETVGVTSNLSLLQGSWLDSVFQAIIRWHRRGS